MRSIRLFAILTCIFILLLSVNVSAINTGFSTGELSEELQKSFVSNVNLSAFTVTPEKKGLDCFDVNENGTVAIGQGIFRRKEVCVYSSEGIFLYGYAFNSSGDFAVEWDGEVINIYFVRSDVIMSVAPDGTVLDVEKVQSTIANSNYYRELCRSIRTVGDTTYQARNDMGILNLFASSYSQVIVTDITGSESVFYDVNSIQLIKMIITVVVVCTFVTIVIVKLVKCWIKLNRGNKKVSKISSSER